MKIEKLQNNNSQFIVYISEKEKRKIDVRFQDETVWLTQKELAEIFQTTRENVTLHINNIFKEDELEKISTCKDFLQVRKEGKHKVKGKSSTGI